MSDYDPLTTTYLDAEAVTMRLTPEDTRALLRRLTDAAQRGVGANLVFLHVTGALTVTHHAQARTLPQDLIKLVAYTDQASIRVDSAMEGYRGRWSHWEISLPYDEAHITKIRSFTRTLERLHRGETHLGQFLGPEPREGP